MRPPGISPDYAWPIKCERVHPALAWAEKGWQCPNLYCTGNAYDACEWRPDGMLLAQHPEYPVVPESGERCPL